MKTVKMKTMWLVAVISLMLVSAPVLGQDRLDVRLEGDVGYTLAIAQNDEKGETEISLGQYGVNVQTLTIGNAAFQKDAIQTVRFCAGCDPVVFIPAYDRSSTYGAETAVLVWSQGGAWSMSILPFQRTAVRDDDGDGVFVLQDEWPEDRGGIRRYEFSYGMLSEAD